MLQPDFSMHFYAAIQHNSVFQTFISRSHLKSASSNVMRNGQQLSRVDNQYGHTFIGEWLDTQNHWQSQKAWGRECVDDIS
eukprot:scaffold294010_cov18-Prasinocladus_malaysianus.AAC.2